MREKASDPAALLSILSEPYFRLLDELFADELDLQRLELRRMSGVPSLRCAYANVPEVRAMSLLNATVRVSGPVEYGADGSLACCRSRDSK